MKFLRDLKERIVNGKAFSRLKKVKNVEIVIAVILAIIAAIVYFAVSVQSGKTSASSAEVGMSESEEKLSELISEIAGVGKTRVLITSDTNQDVVGVVVVAEGVGNMDNRIKVIRCVEKATGATVDKIEIYEMGNGG